MPATKPASAWVFTINNPTADDDPRKWDGVRYVTWQEEKGDEGTRHFQGYVEFEKQKRLSACKKINDRAHWEIRMGTQEQAIAYSQKEETRVSGPWEVGEKGKGQGKRSDLDAVCAKILDGASIKSIAEEHGPLFVQYGRGLRDLQQTTAGHYSHNTVRGVWYWGKPGTGKSHTARADHPEAYIKSQNKWWDGYSGEKSVILDDLDKLGGDKLGHYLKIWADKYACTGEVKGAQANLQHEVFVVTSNYHPDTLWPDDEELREAIKRRFKIKEFKTLHRSDTTEPPPKRFKKTEPPLKSAHVTDTKCPNGCPDGDPCFCAQNVYIGAAVNAIDEAHLKYSNM